MTAVRVRFGSRKAGSIGKAHAMAHDGIALELGATRRSRLCATCTTAPHFALRSRIRAFRRHRTPSIRMSFQSLGVAPWLCQALVSLGITAPTEIQTGAIPPILKGRDVIGKAKTGSGKTAAFALPILQLLAKDPYGIFAVVLTPTRELAFQLAEQFRALGAGMSLRDVVVIGGLDMMPQALALAQRPHLVIATPGRLADHIRSGNSMHLAHCKFLVLDEVDRLMEPKFRRDMDCIQKALPEPTKRQTLLFSATLSKEEVLAGSNQFELREANTDFVQVFTDSDTQIVEQLDQRYLFIPQNIKEVYLVYLLSKSIFAGQSCIVFVSTCRGCEVIAQLLLEVGIQCESLHSRKNQSRRLASLGKFRSGAAKVLVATDVASRGLDIPTVQLVLNYDLPRVAADYIHRVGRTARAGRGGAAISLVSQYDIEVLQSIESTVGKQLSLFELEESSVLELLKSVNAAKRMAKIRLEDYQLTNKVVKRKKKEGESDEEEEEQEGRDDVAESRGPEQAEEGRAPRPQQQQQQQKKKQRQDAEPAAAAAAASSSSSSFKKKQPQPASAAAASSTNSHKKLAPSQAASSSAAAASSLKKKAKAHV